MSGLRPFGRARVRGGSLVLVALLLATSLATPISVAAANAPNALVVATYATAVAGTPTDIGVGATNASGAWLTTYTGTVRFASSDARAALPADYTFQLGEGGLHEFDRAVTFCTLGTQSLSAHDLEYPSRQGSTTVSVVRGAATHFSVTVTDTNPWVAGTGKDVTILALDACGNVDTSYAGTIHFSSSDTNGNVHLPADYTFVAGDAGSHTFIHYWPAGVWLYTAGPQTVTVTDTITPSISGTYSETVVATVPTRYDVSPSPTPWVAGAAWDLTVQAYDPYGNLTTNAAGRTIHFSSSDSRAVLPSDYTFTASDNGSHMFPGVVLKTPGSTLLTIGDGVYSGSRWFSVVAGPTSQFLLSSTESIWWAGASTPLTVTAADAAENAIGTYSGVVHFTSSDPQAVLPADTLLSAGTATVNVTLKTAGSQTVTATAVDGSAITGTISHTVTASAAHHFHIDGFAGSWVAGTPKDVTVTAMDDYGNVDQMYGRTIHFETPGDSRSTLPADYLFVPADHGSHTFSVTLGTAGAVTLVVTDPLASEMRSTADATVSPGAATRLVVSAAGSSIVAGQSPTFTVTARDAFGNVATGYTGTVHVTSSDPAAILPANFTFAAGDAGQRTFQVTLRTSGSRAVTVTDVAHSSITGTAASLPVAPAAAATLVVAGLVSPRTAGAAGTVTVEARDVYGNRATGYRGTVRVKATDAAATLPANYTFTASDAGIHLLTVTLKTAGTHTINVADVASAGIAGSQSGIVVNPAAAAFLVVTVPSPLDAGTAATATVEARDAFGNRATGYRGTVHFTSSDAKATLPADRAFTATDAGIHAFTVTFATVGTQSLTVRDKTASSIAGAQSGIVVGYAAATYHPISPARVLDTRPTNGPVKNIGLSGPFTAGAVRTFRVAGVPGVDMTSAAIPANAVAVTGNLTVVGQTAGGVVSLGPTMTASPEPTTLNFPLGDIRANNVTLALGPGGTLSAVYLAPAGKTTQLIFDLTGYFAAPSVAGGATYHSLTPGRVLDTRPTASGVTTIGLQGQFQNRVVRRFKVAGVKAIGWTGALVPANASAITGNLTVTRSTSGGFVALGPKMPAYPATSTLNVPKGDNRANGVTVKLDAGYLEAVWAGTDGSKADVILDVTGYFTADSSGAKFHPLTPVRLLNTSTGKGLSGAFANRVPRALTVAGRGGVPAGAVGISGNVTIVGATSSGYVFMGPTATSAPTSSTVNTLAADNRANGFDVPLSSGGGVGIVWAGTTGSTANVQLDVTGYWK